MYGEQQATMPSFTSSPTPNPNPNPNSPHADASLYQYTHGFDGLGEQPAFELGRAAASQSEMISQITDTTYEHASGNFGDASQHVGNDMTVPPSQPENSQPVQCEVCNITCNTKEVFEKHTQGKKHLKNMQKIAISSVIGPKVTPPTATATSVGELENKKHMLLQNGASADTLLYCQTCNVVCNNQDVFQTHLAGKKHHAKLASTNAVFNATSDVGPLAQTNPDPLRCELCKISCTSIELLNTHMSGKKHQKKLKESGQIPDPSLAVVPSLDTQPTKPESTTEGKAVNLHEGNPVSCELCGISCNTYEVLKTHLSGKKHQKNLEKSEKVIGPNPAPATEAGMLENEGKEEGKVVNVDGSSRKTKRAGSDEDIEAKRRKILEGGAAMDALRTCTVCNVVCSSPTVYISHLAGRKHAAMAVKQAESGLTGQQT